MLTIPVCTPRIAALHGLSTVLTHCQPMVAQHAYETLAKVTCVYLSLGPDPGAQEPQQPAELVLHRQETLGLCREVVGRLQEGCKPRLDLEGFLRALEKRGIHQVRGLLVEMSQ